MSDFQIFLKVSCSMRYNNLKTTNVLFPCVREGIFFPSFTRSPNQPFLPHSLPSIPPSTLCSVCVLGTRAPLWLGHAKLSARVSSPDSSLPSSSQPPPPTPDLGLEQQPEEP